MKQDRKAKELTQPRPERDCKSSDTQFTIVASCNPKTLTKSFELDDGQLMKTGGGVLVAGSAEIQSVDTLEQFSEIIEGLGPENALIYGVPEQSPVQLMTKAEWDVRGKPAGHVPRTKENFSWPKGSGICMIDYDPIEGEAALSKEQLIAVLHRAVPDLQNTDKLWLPSASSHIVNSETSKDLTGLRGQRVYFIATNAEDISRAGKALFGRLWLLGRGSIKVSASGSLLCRTLIDQSVYQPNRLDFAAGSDCKEPLVQKRGRPEFIKGEKTQLDTTKAIPDLSPNEEKAVEILIQSAREDKRTEAADARREWLEKRAIEMVGDDASPEELEAARRDAECVLSTKSLRGSYLLHVDYQNEQRQLTVSEVLSDQKKYDGCQTLDPIEPDYDGGRRVGKLFLNGQTCVLHSFARGSATYRLEGDIHTIAIVSGRLGEAVNRTLEILRNDPYIFDRGEDLVRADGRRSYTLDQHSLQQELARNIQYFAHRKRKDGMERVLLDPPADLAKRILSMGSRRNLKPLLAVISAPTLREDGSILQEMGYDDQSHLFLHMGDAGDAALIRAEPSVGDVLEALQRLLSPFREFPFVQPIDRSVFLAALLTASVRRSLKTSPAFGFDAPVQGSGKSLLAACVAALATGDEPRLFPHAEGKNDEEVRKRLMSIFREGIAAIVWDNVMGVFDSASFAAALTSADYTDRILGKSQTASSPTRAMMLMTGNNLTFKGDMTRRVLNCRIDPNTERPHDRTFAVDPLKYVLEHRHSMIADCLTILRGGVTHAQDVKTGRLASFEDWSDLVRNAVVWIGTVIAPGEYGDPVGAINTSLASDPDREAWGELLSALYYSFESEDFEAVDVVRLMGTSCSAVGARLAGKLAGDDASSPMMLRDAVGYFSANAINSSSSLGRVFANRKDRIEQDLVLRASNNASKKQKVWRVEVAPK